VCVAGLVHALFQDQVTFLAPERRRQRHNRNSLKACQFREYAISTPKLTPECIVEVVPNGMQLGR
jgi:hypothetical protein